MKKHPIKVAGLSPQELARRVADMRYDAVRDFLVHLSNALRDDAKADYRRNRYMLASFLEDAADRTLNVADSIQTAWNLCEPHMPLVDDQELLDDQGLQDLLSLVLDNQEEDHFPTLATVQTWTPAQRAEAEEWASKTYLYANDNEDVEIPPKPLFLDWCNIRAERKTGNDPDVQHAYRMPKVGDVVRWKSKSYAEAEVVEVNHDLERYCITMEGMLDHQGDDQLLWIDQYDPFWTRC